LSFVALGHAQDKDAIKQALKFTDEGVAAQKSGNHELAINHFDKALSLVDHPKVQYMKAVSLQELKRNEDALEIFERIKKKKEVGKYKKEIYERIATLKNRIAIEKEKAAEQEKAAQEQTLKEKQKAEEAEKQKAIQEQTLKEKLKAARKKAEEEEQVKKEAARLKAEIESAQSLHAPSAEPAVSETMESPTNWNGIFKWMCLGLGVGAGATGGVFTYISESKLTDLNKKLGEKDGSGNIIGITKTGAESEKSTISTYRTTSYIFYGVAGASVAASVLLFILDSGTEHGDYAGSFLPSFGGNSMVFVWSKAL
jgi:tetratricopeptide (TPR) repeat protein